MRQSLDRARASVDLAPGFFSSFLRGMGGFFSLITFVSHRYNEHVMKFLPYRRVLIKQMRILLLAHLFSFLEGSTRACDSLYGVDRS